MSNGKQTQNTGKTENQKIFTQGFDDASLPGDDETWRLLSVYADGEATPAEIAEVEAMILSNPAFASDLNFLQMSGEGVRSYTEVEPPLTLTDSILAKTSHRKTLAQRVQSWFAERNPSLAPRVYRYSFAATASLLVLGIWFSTHKTVKPPVAPSANVASNAKPQPVAIAPEIVPTSTSKHDIVRTDPAPATKKTPSAPKRIEDVIHVEPATLIVPARNADARKVAKSDEIATRQDHLKKNETRPVRNGAELASNGFQNPGNPNPRLEERHIAVNQVASDSSHDASLGHDLDTQPTLVNTNEVITASKPNESSVTSARPINKISYMANNTAPNPEIMRASLNMDMKRSLAEANRELKRESASSPQFKASIVLGSF